MNILTVLWYSKDFAQICNYFTFRGKNRKDFS